MVTWCGLAYVDLITRLLDYWTVPRAWGCRALVGLGLLNAPWMVLLVLGHLVGAAR